VEFVDALEYSILILLSENAVVLNVVDHLEHTRGNNSVPELVYQSFPSEQEVDGDNYEQVDHVEMEHPIFNHQPEVAHIFAVGLLDSTKLSFPGGDIAGHD